MTPGRPAMRTPSGLPGFPAQRNADADTPTPNSAEPAADPAPRLASPNVAKDVESPAADNTEPRLDQAADSARVEKPVTTRKPRAKVSASNERGEGQPSGGETPRIDVQIDVNAKYQANFYGLVALRRHYERLVFDLKQDGENTSLSELFNATLLHGPGTPDQARQLLHDLRKAAAQRDGS